MDGGVMKEHMLIIHRVAEMVMRYPFLNILMIIQPVATALLGDMYIGDLNSLHYMVIM